MARRGMRVLVCGGREFSDARMMDAILRLVDRHSHRYVPDTHGITAIIHGAAQGADSLAAAWAENVGLSSYGEVLAFPADWARWGKRAGLLRNQQMIDEGKPDLVVAFPGGRGTADMVNRARAAGIRVLDLSKRFN